MPSQGTGAKSEPIAFGLWLVGLDQIWLSAPAPRLGGQTGPVLGRGNVQGTLFQENGGVDDVCPGSCWIPVRRQKSLPTRLSLDVYSQKQLGTGGPRKVGQRA